MAVNPERLKQFLKPPPALPSMSTYGTAGLTTVGASSSVGRSHSHGGTRNRPQQVPPIERGDLRMFQTTFRGSANLLAPASPQAARPPAASDGHRTLSAPALPERPPDVGPGGGKSLHDVWDKALFAQAEGLAKVDRTQVMREDGEGNVAVLRMEPDRFYMGRVLRPKVALEKVPAAALRDDGARLMHPRERRAIHDAEVNSRQGYLALREAYKTRRKLATTCAMNYPHGVLGCSETPYAASGLESEIYGAKARELVREDVRAQRKGKAAGGAQPRVPAATGLDIGAADRPPRVTGRAHANVPRDQLNLSVNLRQP